LNGGALPRRLAFYRSAHAPNGAIFAVTSRVSGDHDRLKRHDPVILPPDVMHKVAIRLREFQFLVAN